MQAAAAHEMEISHPLAVMERTHEKQQNFMNFRGQVYIEFAEGPGDGRRKMELAAAFLGGVCQGGDGKADGGTGEQATVPIRSESQVLHRGDTLLVRT